MGARAGHSWHGMHEVERRASTTPRSSILPEAARTASRWQSRTGTRATTASSMQCASTGRRSHRTTSSRSSLRCSRVMASARSPAIGATPEQAAQAAGLSGALGAAMGDFSVLDLLNDPGTLSQLFGSNPMGGTPQPMQPPGAPPAPPPNVMAQAPASFAKSLRRIIFRCCSREGDRGALKFCFLA
jgi:hypothetical protein